MEEWLHFLIKTFKQLICFPKYFKRWKNIIKNSKLNKDEVGILCPYQIGDTYRLCSLSESFIKKNPRWSLALFVKPSHKNVPEMFSKGIKRVVTADMPGSAFLQATKLFYRWNHRIMPGKLLVGDPYFLGKGKLFKKFGSGKITTLSIYKEMLGLSQKTKPSKPQICSKDIKTAREIFKRNNFVRGKTVIIAPEASSISEMPHDFWQKVVDECQKKQLKVIVNGNKYTLKGATNLKFSLKEAIPILELAGYFVSIRSGLCDLVASANCRKFIIYPDIKFARGTFISCFSLKQTGTLKMKPPCLWKSGVSLDNARLRREASFLPASSQSASWRKRRGICRSEINEYLHKKGDNYLGLVEKICLDIQK